MFMEIAQVVAKRATCFRENVGAIVVTGNNIKSIGYNGAPKGHDHCTAHPDGQCKAAVHAEVNALEGTNGVVYHGDLYCTHLPCIECQKAIVASGAIQRVFFSIIYGDLEYAYQFFDRNHIKLLRVLPSGTITSYDRTEILDVTT